jgi:hypothetical protein
VIKNVNEEELHREVGHESWRTRYQQRRRRQEEVREENWKVELEGTQLLATPATARRGLRIAAETRVPGAESARKEAENGIRVELEE